jgi:hypothetical protein
MASYPFFFTEAKHRYCRLVLQLSFSQAAFMRKKMLYSELMNAHDRQCNILNAGPFR